MNLRLFVDWGSPKFHWDPRSLKKQAYLRQKQAGEARDQALSWLKQREEKRRSMRTEAHIASSEEYAEAFGLSGFLSDYQKNYLIEHAKMGRVRITDVAEAVKGDLSHQDAPWAPVNAAYGKLGVKLRDRFGLTPKLRNDDSKIFISHLLSWDGDYKEKSEFCCELLPEVLQGMVLAGLIDEEHSGQIANKTAVIEAEKELELEGRKALVANFGRGNFLWDECLERSAIETFHSEDLFQPWKEQDEAAFYRNAHSKKRRDGTFPNRGTVTRWYRHMTVLSQSCGEIWFHTADDNIWWTITTEEEATYENSIDPDGNRIVVCYKPCRPWSCHALNGKELLKSALSDDAQNKLVCQGTLIRMREQNLSMAYALIEGADLSGWSGSPNEQNTGSKSADRNESRRDSISEMVKNTLETVKHSNGQQVSQTKRNKELRMSRQELEEHISELIEKQDDKCAISDLALQYRGQETDKNMLASLDRIDSDGHYEKGNLQVVCRFINFWKKDSENEEFCRLLKLLRGQAESFVNGEML